MKNISAILLAGGYNSRMGCNKAELTYNGVSFIRHQVNKLRAVGISDIVISGYAKPIDGTRFVPDIYPRLGPLSGIHAGLLAVKNESSLVVSADTPLIPIALFEALVEAHSGRITVVECGGKLEPLIGIYDRVVAEECENVLKSQRTAVSELLKTTGFAKLAYTGDETLLFNCNTPQDYEQLCKIGQR